MSTELWRPILGVEGYEVSNQGNVRSLSGRSVKAHKVSKYGHLQVSFYVDKKRIPRYVHRLVLEAFVGPCPDGLQCCHNDGDATNNRLENLRWDTPSSNMYDKVRHGTHHNANRTHCPHGHPLDAVKRHGDGAFWQRRCRTCTREANREREAAKWAQVSECSKGHPLDGIAYNADKSVRGRFCKTCRSENVSRQMTERHAQARAERTHCAQGHELDGERVRPSGAVYRWCRTCANDKQRRRQST